ncbi:MAG TPA: hypothetical protein VF756_30875 [Thermoanaerobaculia bacterium]
MPKIKESKQFQEWESLLAALRLEACEMQGIEPYQVALEKALRDAQDARLRKDRLYASVVESARQLAQATGRARESASRIRSFLKCFLSPYNRKLGRYGVKPLPRRKRKRPPKPQALSSAPEISMQ